MVVDAPRGQWIHLASPPDVAQENPDLDVCRYVLTGHTPPTPEHPVHLFNVQFQGFLAFSPGHPGRIITVQHGPTRGHAVYLEGPPGAWLRLTSTDRECSLDGAVRICPQCNIAADFRPPRRKPGQKKPVTLCPPVECKYCGYLVEPGGPPTGQDGGL
jgi:hypothetical protein